MVTVTDSISSLPSHWSIADLHSHLGGIPLNRIRSNPSPGHARLKDVVDIQDREGRHCELIDGVLVEKTMGYYEARVAQLIAHFLERYLERNDCGIVIGDGGTLEILRDQVRIPDACFLAWSHFPNRKLPREPIPHVAPDLAVEVLSKSNTKQELARKLQDYFQAGTRCVWYVDPETMTAQSFTSAQAMTSVPEDGKLTAEDILPGFELSLREFFARAGQRREQ